jgi:hypothetical protein
MCDAVTSKPFDGSSSSPKPKGSHMTTVTPLDDYRRRRLARHSAFAALALLLFASLIFEVVKHGGYAWALVGLFGPNVALLFPTVGRAARQLHAVLHVFWGPHPHGARIV